jgi:hypothetical protein
MLVAHAERLSGLGCADNRDLAARIRSGELDDRFEDVHAAVLADVTAKLEVSNPKYLKSER